MSHHAPPHIGGVEQVVWTEASTMLAAGHHVTWVTSDGDGHGERLPSHPNLRILRIPACHWMERFFRIAYPLHAPRLVRALWREVGRADVVHVHGLVFQGSVVGAMFARMRRRHCIVTDHGGLLRYKLGVGTVALRLLMETFGRITARCADQSVALNGEIESLLQRLGGRPERVRCLPNPLGLARFSPPDAERRRQLRESFGWDERPRVLFVGRLLPHKGVEVLLNAAGDSHALVFCGPGHPSLVRRVRDAGAEYFAPRPQPELVALYQAADVLALPSRNEGFPLVVQEALACGLPVVTTDSPAYGAYRELDRLHLCEPRPDALRTAIDAALASNGTPARSVESTSDNSAEEWLEKLLEGIA